MKSLLGAGVLAVTILVCSAAAADPRPTTLGEALAAAEKGDAEAQYLLGFHYDREPEEGGNKDQAIGWYRKAAAQGHVDAMVRLGWALMGTGGESLQWYRKAADLGQPVAQHQMGYFLSGKSPDESREWYRKAAEQGYASSQVAYALLHLRGRGVPKNDVEAMKWFKRAADQGDLNAQWNVAYLREQGKGGLPADMKLAIDLYLDAARKGHVPSYNQLFSLLQQDKIGDRAGEVLFALGQVDEAAGRMDRAVMNFRNAMAFEYPGAKAALERVEKKVSSEQ